VVDIDELKGLPDVEFNFTVSGEVKTAFTNAASTLSGQRGTRAGWRSTALTDFDGHFKDVFTQNGKIIIGRIGSDDRSRTRGSSSGRIWSRCDKSFGSQHDRERCRPRPTRIATISSPARSTSIDPPRTGLPLNDLRATSSTFVPTAGGAK
jgi:hypothetical protein